MLNLDYFIKKFKDIPEEHFELSNVQYALTAWDWLDSEEEQATLYELINPYGMLIAVNDGHAQWYTLGQTPKIRILNFLEYVKRARTIDLVYEY